MSPLASFRRAQSGDGSLPNQTAFPMYKEPVWPTIDLRPESPPRSRMTVTEIMMSGFCGVPCRRLRYADARIHKGDVTAC